MKTQIAAIERAGILRTAVIGSAALILAVQVGRAQNLRFGQLSRMLPEDSQHNAALAAGDVDGDGDRDVLVGNRLLNSDPQNRLYLNDGWGSFRDATATNLPALADSTVSLALGDVDGDGDLDAVVGNCSSYGSDPQNRLHLNDGTGIFADATLARLPMDFADSYALALADLDGDGDLDLLVGNSGAQDRLYANDGTGTFVDVTLGRLPYDSDYTTDLAIGDVDGDGDLDILAASAGRQANRLYLNRGSGVFFNATGSRFPRLQDSTLDVALGDLDSDGDLDALIGNVGSHGGGQQNRIHLNNGSGVFTDATATHLPASSGATWALVLGDVDMDGDLDALIGDEWQSNRILLNDGAGRFTDATATHLPAVGITSRALILEDLDGDGDLDAMNGCGSDSNRLWLNDGSGTFQDATSAKFPLRADRTSALALGDVDGDGDLDVLVGNDGEPNRLYLNNGAGAFTDATATKLPVDWDRTSCLALGDVDADGDLDALIGNGLYCSRGGCWANQNNLYLNDGTGAFTDVTAARLPVALDGTSAVALGDVDGDGDLDAFIGNSDLDFLYLNDGAGVFTDHTETHLPEKCGGTTTLALGDVDGDGDSDALLGGPGPQTRLYLNDGAGIFSDATPTHLPVDSDEVAGVYTSALALGDVDGDGDLDAMVARSWGQDRLYLNDGSGRFLDVTRGRLPAVPRYISVIALGDLDGDGDLDALILSAWGPGEKWRLYLNDGAGAFTDETAGQLPSVDGRLSTLAIGDVDADGDLDALIGCGGYPSGPNRLYTNLTRQLAWRSVPRVGKPLTLDIWGPAHGAWQLAVSSAEAAISLPPIGTLRLDPQFLAPLRSGGLDAGRRASATIQAPGDPVLIETSLYWQALVAFPLGLTNLEITTFTGM